MLSQNLRDFYLNWTAKAEQIPEEKLSDVYDKFITLFIAFNNLYNQIPNALISNGISVPNRIPDNESASIYVVNFLGAQTFLDNLTENQNDLTSIIESIRNERFYIRLYYGQRQRNEDLRILTNLESTNNRNKAIAILNVIYYVRCNMFHGHKDFVEYQRELVAPLIRILKKINLQLFIRLDN